MAISTNYSYMDNDIDGILGHDEAELILNEKFRIRFQKFLQPPFNFPCYIYIRLQTLLLAVAPVQSACKHCFIDVAAVQQVSQLVEDVNLFCWLVMLINWNFSALAYSRFGPFVLTFEQDFLLEVRANLLI